MKMDPQGRAEKRGEKEGGRRGRMEKGKGESSIPALLFLPIFAH